MQHAGASRVEHLPAPWQPWPGNPRLLGRGGRMRGKAISRLVSHRFFLYKTVVNNEGKDRNYDVPHGFEPPLEKKPTAHWVQAYVSRSTCSVGSVRDRPAEQSSQEPVFDPGLTGRKYSPTLHLKQIPVPGCLIASSGHRQSSCSSDP